MFTLLHFLLLRIPQVLQTPFAIPFLCSTSWILSIWISNFPQVILLDKEPRAKEDRTRWMGHDEISFLTISTFLLKSIYVLHVWAALKALKTEVPYTTLWKETSSNGGLTLYTFMSLHTSLHHSISKLVAVRFVQIGLFQHVLSQINLAVR